jgi:Na+-transporting methylmalonyl-CoA/oxaloacetate decarboxylase gamma subunit
MPSWIEPPPKQRKTGCLGKGCMMVVVFLVLLAVAFFIGGYVGVRYVVTSDKPKEIPQVESTEAEQEVVRNRWEEFKAAPQSTPVEATMATTTTTTESTPAPTPTSNRIELSASDINQLIAGSRKTRGKAFVSIENNIARVQVSVPLEKFGFRGRFLNGELQVRSAPDKNPRNIEITEVSMGGVSDKILNSLLDFRSLRSYADQYATEYAITSFAIEDNKVVIENGRAIPGVTR